MGNAGGVYFLLFAFLPCMLLSLSYFFVVLLFVVLLFVVLFVVLVLVLINSFSIHFFCLFDLLLIIFASFLSHSHLRQLRSSRINSLVDQWIHDRDSMEHDFRACDSAEEFMQKTAWFADTSVEMLASNYIKHFSLGSTTVLGSNDTIWYLEKKAALEKETARLVNRYE